jgi:hypothetical protein
MSEWIESRLAAHQKSVDDLRTIWSGSEILFTHLWEEIVELAKFAESKDMRISTNGSPHERTVLMGMYPVGNQSSAHPRALKIALKQDRRKISASSDAGNIEFSVAVCDDGVICLKDDLFPVSTRDAARKIMEPFLFEGKSPFRSSDL